MGVRISSRHSIGVDGTYFTTGARNQKTGAMFSSAWIEMFFDLNITIPYDSNIDLRSITFFGEPSLGARYKIIKGLSASLDLGCQIDSYRKLYEKDDSESFLMKGYDDYVYINWSGLRVSLGLTYYFNYR